MNENINLPKKMISHLSSIGYQNLTPIQKAAIPHLLEKRDLIAKAKTGSGKTAAFGIPTLLKIDVKNFTPQALIITPTRELASQVTLELQKLAKFTHNIKILNLSGGSSMRYQMHSLRHGCHIVVGTAGRLEDHLSKKSLDLSKIETLILDEADRMLDMGFYDSISKIIEKTPKSRQSLLFSATFEENIKELCQNILINPVFIEVDTTHKDSIKESFYLSKNSKREDLIKLLYFYQANSTIIFCNTKKETQELSDFLYERGFSSLALHGDLEQFERDEVLIQFSNKSFLILVATDVAARGLHIEDVELVVNYDLPRDEDTYTHRIGRTARLNKSGEAVSIFKQDEIKDNEISIVDINTLTIENKNPKQSLMQTIFIEGGKKDKLSAGDILGTLVKKADIKAQNIGKIDIFPKKSFVAIRVEEIQKALLGIKKNQIKGKNFRAWRLD